MPRFFSKLLTLAAFAVLAFGLMVPLLPGWQTGEAEAAATATTPTADKEMRGVWVSSVINLDYPKAPTTSADELRKQADAILDGAVDCGFNAIFLQVRPCADALYKSEIYPWSIYLTGQHGVAPNSGFDPLAYWVEGAHKRGLELHAWINPYRITKSLAEWDKLAASSPAKKHPEWTVLYKDNYYFNPALPEVRQLVIDGAVELAQNYAVDGVHLDDYFYPGTDFDDAKEYAAQGGSYADIGDWRRNNVNLLVQGLNDALHKVRPEIQFGISPAGIWASNTLNPAGSATTSTYSSYYNMYADSRGWVKSGWLDYIAPQIYWEAGHKTADFTALLNWWSDVVSGTKVKLYIGLADYKTLEAKAADSPWYDGAEITRQIKACSAKTQVAGTIHFRYGSISGSQALQRVLQQAYAGQTNNSNAVNGNLNNNTNSTANSSTNNSNKPNQPSITEVSTGNGEIRVLVDGKQLTFDQQPYIEAGRVMLPMRIIFQELGATVNYADRRIEARRGDIVIKLALDSTQMQVGNKTQTIDVPAVSVNGRTMLPLRAVAEALHCKVQWDNSTKTVTITNMAD